MRRFVLTVVLLWGWLVPSAQAATKIAQPPVLLVMGDSLSAAYGIALEQGWVALMQQRLREQGFPHQVVNASISGETTAGGLSRLPKALTQYRPQLVLLELAANDGLRGQSLSAMRENLARMIQLSHNAGAQVLLFEMRLPVNYGEDYTTQFNDSIHKVAKQEKVTLVPFFLAPIAGELRWFQDDGVHPTAVAQPLLLQAVWPTLQPLLKP